MQLVEVQPGGGDCNGGDGGGRVMVLVVVVLVVVMVLVVVIVVVIANGCSLWRGGAAVELLAAVYSLWLDLLCLLR